VQVPLAQNDRENSVGVAYNALAFTKPSVSQLQTQKINLPIFQIGWAHNVVVMA